MTPVSANVIDARAGAHISLENAGCWPAPSSGSALRAAGCLELYGEVTYVNRYAHDVIGFVRGRSSLSFAITGPLEWQLSAELRAAKDKNGEDYNNFADLGAGPRLRLLAPVHVDLMLAPHFGSYFGQQHLDPAPDPLHDLDLRAQAATSLEF